METNTSTWQIIATLTINFLVLFLSSLIELKIHPKFSATSIKDKDKDNTRLYK